MWTHVDCWSCLLLHPHRHTFFTRKYHLTHVRILRCKTGYARLSVRGDTVATRTQSEDSEVSQYHIREGFLETVQCKMLILSRSQELRFAPKLYVQIHEWWFLHFPSVLCPDSYIFWLSPHLKPWSYLRLGMLLFPFYSWGHQSSERKGVLLEIILLIDVHNRIQIRVYLPPKQFLFHSYVASEMAGKLRLQACKCLCVLRGNRRRLGRRIEPLFLFLDHFLKIVPVLGCLGGPVG